MGLGCESRGFRQIAYPRDRSIVGSFFIRESHFKFGAKHAVIGITGRIGDAAVMPYMKPVIVPASIAFVMTKAACVRTCKHRLCVHKVCMRAIVLASMGCGYHIVPASMGSVMTVPACGHVPHPFVEASPKPLCIPWR